jgi:hypothetical protein
MQIEAERPPQKKYPDIVVSRNSIVDTLKERMKKTLEDADKMFKELSLQRVDKSKVELKKQSMNEIVTMEEAYPN